MLCIINVMQKIVNVLAIASSVVSLAVIGGGVYLYVQKDAIIEDIKEKALGSIGSGLGSSLLEGDSMDMPTPELPTVPIDLGL